MQMHKWSCDQTHMSNLRWKLVLNSQFGSWLDQSFICPLITETFLRFPLLTVIMWINHKLGWFITWSSLLVCRRRCLRKSKREHFRTRIRSVVPSARWAAGERPLGLRGQAQLILAAFMARNFPRIVLHSPSLSETRTPPKKALTFLAGATANHLFLEMWLMPLEQLQNWLLDEIVLSVSKLENESMAT